MLDLYTAVARYIQGALDRLKPVGLHVSRFVVCMEVAYRPTRFVYKRGVSLPREFTSVPVNRWQAASRTVSGAGQQPPKTVG